MRTWIWTIAMLAATCVAGGGVKVPSTSAEPAPVAAEPGDIATDTSSIHADGCGAGKLGGYLGALPTTDVMARIQTAIGGAHIRMVRPNGAVTMDYRADRLNIELGDDGRIARLRCG